MALATATTMLAAPPADADRGPCIPGTEGPTCRIWTGTVGAVDDGDTINVDVAGDGTSKERKIRLTGIQAMELTRYGKRRGRLGECNGVAAAERLEEIVRRGRSRVRIAARSASSTTGARNRLRRAITVGHGGKRVDPAKQLIEEGLAIWFPHAVEWPWNRSYSRLAARARLDGLGIWNPSACGPVPAGTIQPPRMKVKWDGGGVDGKDPNSEWARITNTDPTRTLSLAGWWFRDSHLRRYTFPAGAAIAPGDSIRVHPGNGPNDENTFHWDLGETVFENVSDDRKQMGDGGYLFDPRGNLRAAVQYPCRVACREPLAGKLDVVARQRGRESIVVKNISRDTVALWEYEIESRPWFYEFDRDAVLAPGDEFTLWIGRADGPEGPRNRGWGFEVGLLGDRRDVVTLRNPLGAPVDCDAWGGLRCPRV